MDYISLAKENFMSTYSTQDLCVDHAKGVRIFDTDGNCYLDMVAGIAVNALGYDNEKIKERVKEVMDDGFFHADGQLVDHREEFQFSLDAAVVAQPAVLAGFAEFVQIPVGGPSTGA